MPTGSWLARFEPRQVWRSLQMVEPLREQVARDQKAVLRELRALRRLAEETETRMREQVAAHEQLLSTIPDLRREVDRLMALYQEDARWADQLTALRASVNYDAIHAHARRVVDAAHLELDPCPHVVIDSVLPDDIYDALVQALPSPVFFDKVDERRDEMIVPFTCAPAFSRFVWSLFHDVVDQTILPALVDKFRPALDTFVRSTWPSLGSWTESQIVLRQANPRLMLRRAGYEIKPHRDPRWGFLTMLLYLVRRDSSSPAYGTQLFRLREERDEPHTSPFWARPDECELVRDIPGTANRALVFLNGTGAHGAAVPPDAPPDFLRYVYQARFSPDSATKARLIELLAAADRDRWVAAR